MGAQSGTRRSATSRFHSLSATTSVSSLPGMVRGQERTPLVNQVDVEAGNTEYGSLPSTRPASCEYFELLP